MLSLALDMDLFLSIVLPDKLINTLVGKPGKYIVWDTQLVLLHKLCLELRRPQQLFVQCNDGWSSTVSKILG